MLTFAVYYFPFHSIKAAVVALATDSRQKLVLNFRQLPFRQLP